MNTQYTIRNVAPSLDAKLRAKAARERIPLNSALLEVLQRGIEAPNSASTRHHDFDDLAHSWVPDPAFDAAMRDARQVDARDWS